MNEINGTLNIKGTMATLISFSENSCMSIAIKECANFDYFDLGKIYLPTSCLRTILCSNDSFRASAEAVYYAGKYYLPTLSPRSGFLCYTEATNINMSFIPPRIDGIFDVLTSVVQLTLPYLVTSVGTGVLFYGAYKAYKCFISVPQKIIQSQVTTPVLQPTVIIKHNPMVRPEKIVSTAEAISTGRKDLKKAVSTFEQSGLANYLKSEFEFAKAALYSTGRAVANLFLATLSIFAVVTAKGRAYFKSCAYRAVTNLGSALIGTLGAVSPHLARRIFNAIY